MARPSYNTKKRDKKKVAGVPIEEYFKNTHARYQEMKKKTWEDYVLSGISVCLIAVLSPIIILVVVVLSPFILLLYSIGRLRDKIETRMRQTETNMRLRNTTKAREKVRQK